MTTECPQTAQIGRTAHDRRPVGGLIPTGPEKSLYGLEIELHLPWPPSVNRIWRNVVIGRSARTLLSRDGRAFFARAAGEVLAQRKGRRIAGRVEVDLVLHPPTRAALDIDNRAKAVLDACTKGGLWADDSQVDVLIVRRDCVLKGGAVIVRATEIQAVPQQAEMLAPRETEDLWA